MTGPATIALAASALLIAPAAAQGPPAAGKKADPIAEMFLKDKAAWEKFFRNAILDKQGLPDPLVTESQDWGKQNEHAVLGLGKRGGQPATQKLNAGLWRRMTIRADDPKSLAITIADVRKKGDEPGRYAITADIALKCVVRLEMQEWVRGAKLLDGSAEATFDARQTVECEFVLTIVPRAPFVRLSQPNVTDTKLAYGELKPRALLGKPFVGKTAEYFTGKLVAAAKAVKPTAESELLEKANAGMRKKVDAMLKKAMEDAAADAKKQAEPKKG